MFFRLEECRWEIEVGSRNGQPTGVHLLRSSIFYLRSSFATPRVYSFSTPLVQYFANSSAVGTWSGRTMRKPTILASVRYQMLLGNCGSCIFQLRSEPSRAPLRKAGGSSSQEPPRTECGYGLVALFQGSVTTPFWAQAL